MPQTSPDDSSTKSKPARKGSAQSARDAANAAFAGSSNLNLSAHDSVVPPEQRGRWRLNDSFRIERSRIMPDPEQPRRLFDQQEMRELTDSIRERGIKQPLTVRWEVAASKYVIIDGGRRFAAAETLDFAELPCWVQKGEPREVLIDQIVHNWQRADLRPYETADALARLRDEFGLDQKELARLIGKSKAEISKFLSLHDKVVPEVQLQARESTDSELTKRHLYNISKLKPLDQLPMADRVRKEKLTAKQTENLIKQQSPELRIRRVDDSNLRKRRFKTDKADVVMTFRKRSVSSDDIADVLTELMDQIAQPEAEK